MNGGWADDLAVVILAVGFAVAVLWLGTVLIGTAW